MKNKSKVRRPVDQLLLIDAMMLDRVSGNIDEWTPVTAKPAEKPNKLANLLSSFIHWT